MAHSKPLRILFIGAHPDDETVLAGGVLSLLAQQGHHVQVVCATRGEGGELGEPPVVASRAMLGDAREAELRGACEAMGVTELTLLGYIDPTVGADNTMYPFTDDPDVLVEQLKTLIHDAQANIILTHGTDGEYGHPAHVLMHQSVMQAIHQLQPKTCVVYSVAAMVPSSEDHLLNQSDLAHFALDITPWVEKKYQAALCHVSQHALFKRALKVQEIRDAIRHESFYRQWPVTNDVPVDAFAEILIKAEAIRPIFS